MNRYAIILLSLVACKHVDRATLVTSTATIACDWGQTRSRASEGWVDGYYETNPIMGRAPSASAVDTYFMSALAINAALWYVIPPKWRSILPAGITVVQADTVVDNHAKTPGTCGL